MSVYESTAEQKARDMVKRMGVETGYLSSGDVVELANLIAAVDGFTWEDVDQLRAAADWFEQRKLPNWKIRDLANRIAALLPPRDP